ncbi:MAG: hypothetical protein ACRC2R_15555 [Xenococcaceae cyanobacterium]
MVDWQAISSEASEYMTNTLFALYSEDLSTRKQALDDLFEICWHQGSVSEKSYLAIPCMIERLETETDIDLLEWLISKIYHIGTGTSYHDTHQTLIHYRERKETPEYQAKIVEELNWVDAVTREFNKGVEVYLKLLEHYSPKIRFEAIYCLSCCLANTEYICHQLYDRFTNESDGKIRTIIPLCLAFMSNTEAIDLAFLEKIIDLEASDLVKLSASIALAFITKEKLSDRYMDNLIVLITKPNLFKSICEYGEAIPQPCSSGELVEIPVAS